MGLYLNSQRSPRVYSNNNEKEQNDIVGRSRVQIKRTELRCHFLFDSRKSANLSGHQISDQ